MRGLAKIFLSTLAAVVWAGTASAASIDLTVIDGWSPGEYAEPSDVVLVEVSLDSAGVGVNNYFMTIVWDDNISLSGIVAGSQWLPVVEI